MLAFLNMLWGWLPAPLPFILGLVFSVLAVMVVVKLIILIWDLIPFL